MNYLGRVIGNLKGLYSGINGATLTGAIDVVIVEQEDGTFKCSPFHVRFGKLGVLRSREKVVDIELNGVPAPIRMKLGDSGEAFFVQETYDFDSDDENLATSPLPASPQLSDCDSSPRSRGEELGVNNNKIPKSSTIHDNAATIITSPDEVNGGNVSPTKEFLGGKGGDDSKNRKRRKKRRRNQGSKSNIVVDPLVPPPEDVSTASQEGIFRMDEEINKMIKALDASGYSQSRSNHHRDFYSDTEVDVTTTPNNSRPSTPIQSDSEYEIKKIQQHNSGDEEVGKWPWGELYNPNPNLTVSGSRTTTALGTPASTPMGPQPSTLIPANDISNNNHSGQLSTYSSDDESMPAAGRAERNKSVLGSMFSFMTKRHASGNGGPTVGDSSSGIYLDDLNLEKMDPEVAALYFPNFGRDLKDSPRREQDDDVESGNGSSIAQSPAPGSSPKSSHASIYIDEETRRDENLSPVTQFPSKFEAISICGSNLALFEQSQLTFDELIENPDIILNTPPESIVVKLDGQLVPWSVALPQLLSTTFFKRPLPSQLHDRLIGQNTKKDDTMILPGPSPDPSAIPGASNGKDAKKAYSWFPWRRSTAPEGELESQLMSSNSPPLSDTASIKDELEGITPMEVVEDAAVNRENAINLLANESSSSSDESEGGGGLRPRVSSTQPSPSHKPVPVPPLLLNGATSINIGSEKYKKSLRLTSDQIMALDLQYGQNEALFSVTTAYQGTTVARCHIYLWRFDDRVVVSDIDGTITKSDVLGHILPIIGNDWAQSGVAQLFTHIQDNGYKMLYLSARSIGQATTTREYLRSIKQDDVTLPDGPLLLNPTSLMSALHREVIEKKPEEFKIACLRDIQTLFPMNPFYAGYGNKINDVWAYRAVDIAIPRIFTINHKGELRHALTNTFQSSYTSLVELAEFIFPAYKILYPVLTEDKEESSQTHTFSTTDGFSSFEFWRSPVPELPGLNGDSWPSAVLSTS